MSGKLVLINRTKVKHLLSSTGFPASGPLGDILNAGRSRLKGVSKASGCNCKKGPQRNKVYDDILVRLRQLTTEELEPLKTHFNATTLNLGNGYQV